MKKLLTAFIISVYFVPASIFVAIFMISSQEQNDSQGFDPFIIPVIMMLIVCVLVVASIVVHGSNKEKISISLNIGLFFIKLYFLLLRNVEYCIIVKVIDEEIMIMRLSFSKSKNATSLISDNLDIIGVNVVFNVLSSLQAILHLSIHENLQLVLDIFKYKLKIFVY